jgi:flagellin-specific chaperone FliS
VSFSSFHKLSNVKVRPIRRIVNILSSLRMTLNHHHRHMCYDNLYAIHYVRMAKDYIVPIRL